MVSFMTQIPDYYFITKYSNFTKKGFERSNELILTDFTEKRESSGVRPSFLFIIFCGFPNLFRNSELQMAA